MATGSPSIEQAVRPFVTVESRPVALISPAPVTDLEAEPAAYMEWGQASQFIPPDSRLDDPLVVEIPDPDDFGDWELPGTGSGGTFEVPPSDILRDWDERIEDLEEQQTEPDPALVFTEISRKSSTKRITNPTDAAQYVDVERIDEIDFRGPEGQRVRWVLRHDVVA